MIWFGRERRRYVRVNKPIKVRIHTDKFSLLTHTENFALGGVSVIIDQQLSAGEIVNLEVFLGSDTFKCRGKIAWSLKVSGKDYESAVLYETGIEFLDLTDEDRQKVYAAIRDLF